MKLSARDQILRAALGHGAEIWEYDNYILFEINSIPERDIYQIKSNLNRISEISNFDVVGRPNYLDIDFLTNTPRQEYSIRGKYQL